MKAKIEASHQLIHENNIETQSLIVPRTQARNVKQTYCNIEEMTADRAAKLAEQIRQKSKELRDLKLIAYKN